MKEFTGGKGGKLVILELERGEKLIETIEARLKALGIKNAVVVSAVGSLQRLCFHRPTTFSEAAEDEFFDIKAPLEICSLSGSVINGVGHFHFSAAGQDGIYGGHLETDTESLYLFEVTLMELEGFHLKREVTPENVKKLFEM